MFPGFMLWIQSSLLDPHDVYQDSNEFELRKPPEHQTVPKINSLFNRIEWGRR